MALMNTEKLFGELRCFMYSVEWQKGGLPYVHILLTEHRLTPDNIDNLILVEIPNPDEDPLLYNIVKSNMIHGPCGNLNSNLACMGKCSKRYPRVLLKETQTGEDGYP